MPFAYDETGGARVWHFDEDEKRVSRRGFLKLGFAGLFSGVVLLLLPGCAGEVEEDDDDDDGSGRRRRRRRRR